MRIYRAQRSTRIIGTLLAFLIILPSNAFSADPLLPSARIAIPNGTPVELLLTNTVSSAHAHVGDPLEFTVMRDVTLVGRTVIRAGSQARGTITAVRHKRILGIGGEVDFKVDSVPLASGASVQLQAKKKVKGPTHYLRIGAEMIGAALLYMPAAPIFLLSRGDDSTVLKSTEVTAHIAGNPSVALATLPADPAPSSELSQALKFLPARVLTAEGRPADMVNLLFVGDSGELQAAFQRAGWVKTDQWQPIMAWHLFCQRNHDARLPMARFYLFGRVQDYSYALPDPDAIVTRRHHLRIWKTQYTVDGDPVWVGAATHDVAIEIAKRGRVINHTIDPAVDAERDFIGSNLDGTHLVSRSLYLEAPEPVFFANTASGEAFYSDSRILLLDLHKTKLAEASQPSENRIASTIIATPAGIATPAAASVTPSSVSFRSSR